MVVLCTTQHCAEDFIVHTTTIAESQIRAPSAEVQACSANRGGELWEKRKGPYCPYEEPKWSPRPRSRTARHLAR